MYDKEICKMGSFEDDLSNRNQCDSAAASIMNTWLTLDRSSDMIPMLKKYDKTQIFTSRWLFGCIHFWFPVFRTLLVLPSAPVQWLLCESSLISQLQTLIQSFILVQTALWWELSHLTILNCVGEGLWRKNREIHSGRFDMMGRIFQH